MAINYHNIGYAKEALGDLDTALANYEKSLSYNNEIDSEIGRVICYNSIGGIYLKQKNYKDAEPIINEALDRALKVEDKFYIDDHLDILYTAGARYYYASLFSGHILGEVCQGFGGD